jgi:acyl-CoA synthetase (AMP-forming)/AMP-acid ligase II
MKLTETSRSHQSACFFLLKSDGANGGKSRDPHGLLQFNLLDHFGRHHTGDIGYLDSDNFLYIVDRAKDMIITGGFNVYSVEVEQALRAHEAVQDCAVVGLPDEKWGECIVAVVQARPGCEIDTARAASRGFRSGSGATNSSLWCHVRFTLGSDRTADIPDRQLRATSGRNEISLC